MIKSEIHPTDHKNITSRNFPDEGFREADSEFVESENDNKRVEAEFLRVYEFNKQHRVHNVWCLDPANRERASLRGFRTIRRFTPLNFLQLPFRIQNLVLES